MTSPWRVLAAALGLSVVAAVLLNAQSLWLNVRYAVAPGSFSLPPAVAQAETPKQTTTAALAVAPTAPVPLPTPKVIGITNANLARIPVGDGLVNYTKPTDRQAINFAFAKQQKGKLFVAVETRGELWYVNPTDAHRYRVPSLSTAASFIATLTNPSPAAVTLAASPGVPANTLTVSSLGLQVPVVYVTQATEDAFQAGLKNGVVHYPGSANPGNLGNDYIFGHSSDYWWSNGRYRTVFAVLPQIKIGADIILTNAQGQAFTYRVFEAKVVAATDVSYLGQYAYKRKLVTLQTSWPIGTAFKRFVVIGELVK